MNQNASNMETCDEGGRSTGLDDAKASVRMM